MIFQGHSPRDCENRCAPRRMASAMMTNPVARKTPRCACPAAVSARTIVLRQAAPVTKPRKHSSILVNLARTNCNTSLPAERHTTNVNPVANKMPSSDLIDDTWRTHSCVPRRHSCRRFQILKLLALALPNFNSNSHLETNTEVNTFATNPNTNVTANPLTGPTPNRNRQPQDHGGHVRIDNRRKRFAET